MSPISLAEAHAAWLELAELFADQRDTDALAQGWNDYTDSLLKGGQLTALQYHYAPAHNERMPGVGSKYDSLADDRAHVLAAMGVTLKATRSLRPREDWPGDASHWHVTLRRNDASLTTTYSMGSAHTGGPELQDVLNCMLSDAQCGEYDFADFCAELGYDEDSRKAERTWRECRRMAKRLTGLFDSAELGGLRELFADY